MTSIERKERTEAECRLGDDGCPWASLEEMVLDDAPTEEMREESRPAA